MDEYVVNADGYRCYVWTAVDVDYRKIITVYASGNVLYLLNALALSKYRITTVSPSIEVSTYKALEEAHESIIGMMLAVFIAVLFHFLEAILSLEISCARFLDKECN